MKNFNLRVFKNPGREYSIIPFWFINKIPKRDEIEQQLSEMKEKKVEQFFIHPRMGLEVPDYIKSPLSLGIFGGTLYAKYFTEERKKRPTPYLRAPWWKIISQIIEIAKKKGMKAWIYDEFDWPSGTAGMTIPVKHPEFRAKYLIVSLHTSGRVNPIRNVNLAIWHNMISNGVKMEERVKYAYLVRGKEMKNVTKRLLQEKEIQIKKGEVVVLFNLFETDDYIDVMNKDAVKEFLNLTHEKYLKRYKSEFGKTIPGFFSDEVTLIHHLSLDKLLMKKIIPWTEDLEEYFYKENKYKMEERLPLLLLNIEGSEKFRCDFWKTVTKVYSENFHNQIKRWSERHKVIYTGHILGEEPIVLQLAAQGNIFEVLRNFHLPGLDHLGRICFGIHPKIVSSVAHYIRSNRVLCEAFGGSGRGMKLNDLRKIANWLYAQGVNLLNPHAFYMSTEGFRKYDAPPSQFIQADYWNEYGSFSQYIKRLSYFTSSGEHNPDVAVYYPVESLLAKYNLSLLNPELSLIFNELSFISLNLSLLHLDFDFLDEKMLLGAEFKNGKIRMGDEEYSALILPSTPLISLKVMKKIEEAVKNKIKILATTVVPSEGIDQEDKKVRSWSKKTFGIDDKILDRRPIKPLINLDSIATPLSFPLGLGKVVSDIGERILKVLLALPDIGKTEIYRNKKASFIRTDFGILPTSKNLKALSEVLKDLDKDFEIIPVKGDSRFISVLKRRTKREKMYLFVNTDSKDITVRVRFKKAVKVVDFDSGKVESRGRETEISIKDTKAVGFVM